MATKEVEYIITDYDEEGKISGILKTCHNKPMHKAGFIWSGKNRIQRFRCNTCGRTTAKKEAK